jgi:hypothetical protein
MSFRAIVTYCIKSHRIGYYATRQNMLRNGASLQDVHKMLAMRLRILGA